MHNLSSLVPSLTPNEVLSLLLIPEVLLVNIRDMSRLGPFSIIANASNIFAYCVVFAFDYAKVGSDCSPNNGTELYCLLIRGRVCSLTNRRLAGQRDALARAARKNGRISFLFGGRYLLLRRCWDDYCSGVIRPKGASERVPTDLSLCNHPDHVRVHVLRGVRLYLIRERDRKDHYAELASWTFSVDRQGVFVLLIIFYLPSHDVSCIGVAGQGPRVVSPLTCCACKFPYL